MNVITKKGKRKSDDRFRNNDLIYPLEHKEAGYNITYNMKHHRHKKTIDIRKHLYNRYDKYLYLEQSEITNRNSPIITSRGQHTTSQPVQYNSTQNKEES